MAQIFLTTGRTFVAEDGQTLLDAGLSAGVSLPYSCRTGRCSTCRCRVATGTTVALHDELGLSADERADGWVLSCVRSAVSDVTLEAEDLGDLRPPVARTVPCRIQEIERVASDVVRVMLRLPPKTPLDYLAGQYIDVIGPGGVRRSYSIANWGDELGRLELHVRKVDGGAMSAFWFGDAKPNDLLRLHGPLGTFFLREAAGLDLVFLATGTGIAPVKAILESLRDLPADARPLSTRVYWGGRTAQDLYWSGGSAAEADAPLVRVLSRADAGWRGVRGHVQHAFMAEAPDLSRTLVYACGSDDMIHDARSLLANAGLPEHRFRSDAFVCSAAV